MYKTQPSISQRHNQWMNAKLPKVQILLACPLSLSSNIHNLQGSFFKTVKHCIFLRSIHTHTHTLRSILCVWIVSHDLNQTVELNLADAGQPLKPLPGWPVHVRAQVGQMMDE